MKLYKYTFIFAYLFITLLVSCRMVQVDPQDPKEDNIEKIKVLSYEPTQEEIDMTCFVVQNEVGGLSKYHKQIITYVIINRVNSPDFPDSIYEVLTQKNQFTCIINYFDYINYGIIPSSGLPTEDTITAVTEVFNNEITDFSQGALFYYSPKYAKSQHTINWFESLTFLFEIKERSYNTIYVHRFFK